MFAFISHTLSSCTHLLVRSIDLLKSTPDTLGCSWETVGSLTSEMKGTKAKGRNILQYSVTTSEGGKHERRTGGTEVEVGTQVEEGNEVEGRGEAGSVHKSNS